MHNSVKRIIDRIGNPELDIIKSMRSTFDFAAHLKEFGALGVRYVTWIRSNFVLRAFSQLSKEAVCHEANMRLGRNSSAAERLVTWQEIAKCRHSRYSVGRADLEGRLTQMACQNSRLAALGRELRAYQMLYESFVANQTAALLGLFRHLNLPASHLSARNHSTMKKRSARNVSSMITNAAEMRRWLDGWGAGASVPLAAMLDARGSTPFSLHAAERFCRRPRSEGLLSAVGRWFRSWG